MRKRGAEKGTMPRRPRICPGGTCFHVINRAVARLTLFEKEADYIAFERVLAEARNKVALPIFAYIVMPNHWHFVVKPKNKNQASNRFLSVADAYPHNALARSLPHRRNGAFLPRAIQGLSDSGRWSSPSSYPLRRAQCLAC